MPDPAAYDFCWSQAAGTWNGPVMKGFGIAAGVQYQQVSEYIPVDVAATTVRLVVPNAADCNTGLAEGVFTPPNADAIYLVALFVSGNVSAQVKVFPDERHISSSSHTKIRAIHAGLAGVGTGGNTTENVDFYLNGGVSTASLFDNVPFGGTAPQGNSVDALGYIEQNAIPSSDLRVRRHTGLVDLLDVPGFAANAQHVYSVFTTGVHAQTVIKPLQLVVCDDSAAPLGHLFLCTATGTQL